MKKISFFLVCLLCLSLFAGCAYQDASYYQYEENDDGTVTIVGIDETYSKKLEIPGKLDGKIVTAIGEYAFYNNDYIREILLPDSITEIGECAFADANMLTTVTLGDKCKIIGLQAFEGCDVLSEINLSEKLEVISDLAFNGCIRLDEFNAPASLKFIGTGAFDNCEQLIMITENSTVATEYAETNRIPTGFSSSDGYIILKLIIGTAVLLTVVLATGYFLKKIRKK